MERPVPARVHCDMRRKSVRAAGRSPVPGPGGAGPRGRAWRAFEILYLQLDRQGTPCSPYRHLPADLGLGGHPAAGLAWTTPDYDKRFWVVDWLIGICQGLDLGDEVLHRGVHLMDRVMQIAPVPLSDLHALAGAALVLASKYEEAECIITRDVVQAAHGDLRMDDVIRLEWRAARALGYRLDGGTARCWVLHLLGVKMRDLPPDVRYRLDRSLLLGEYLALPRPTLARQLLRCAGGGGAARPPSDTDFADHGTPHFLVKKHASYAALARCGPWPRT